MYPILIAALLPAPLAAGPIASPEKPETAAPYDILAAEVSRTETGLRFRMQTLGEAGSQQPEKVGKLEGAAVHAYVWPLSLDPEAVGFEAGTGILALAATRHSDFDDTPLYDEDGDGDMANDGDRWHSHWVVLRPDEACGPGALAVRDIPEGETPKLPKTWPGLPLFIDSPGFVPQLDGDTITVDVEIADMGEVKFDGVTAALRVNANLHAPLLCVTDVFDVASGDLSLPGTAE
ncbi:MAG TPA: hypothetical protein PLI43_06330 [Albidovulum sp.]|nr:hypothetical protein [Albidovulum sp.]